MSVNEAALAALDRLEVMGDVWTVGSVTRKGYDADLATVRRALSHPVAPPEPVAPYAWAVEIQIAGGVWVTADGSYGFHLTIPDAECAERHAGRDFAAPTRVVPLYREAK